MPCSRKSAMVDPRTGAPSSSIEPSSARSRPASTLASSVRPAPDRPQMPRISPASGLEVDLVEEAEAGQARGREAAPRRWSARRVDRTP